MTRIIIALCVIGSFNIIAIQLFMTGNVGPLNDVLPYQQALMISACFIVMLDIFLVYLMMTMGNAHHGKADFDKMFKQHYNGKNFDEAFKKAGLEFRNKL